MNKKLIALAIATAVSAPAMAATSNVEVYGLMSMGIDSVNNNNNAAGDSSKRVGRVSDYASRIGFKGAEDLGNGLSAIWQIESGITADGGATTDSTGVGSVGGSTSPLGGAALRNTFVGLKSDAVGTGMIGKLDTPYKTSTGRLDPFVDTLGDYNSLVGAATGKAATAYFDLRAANVAEYVTPNFSGFSAAGAYVFGAENATTGSASTGNAYSLAAMYDAGPLYLTAAYEKQNFGSANTGSFGTATASNADQKAWKLGAAYSIMDFTLAAMYEKTDDSLGVNGVNLLGHRTWYVSGKYQMGAVALKAAYANAGTAVANDGAKSYTVGADYGFSKRTSVYALYTKINNDSNAVYNFAYNAANGVGGGDTVDGFSLGMKHSF